MGEMVMKELFNKENYLSSTFDGAQRKQSAIVTALLCVFFALSAFTFFNALYAFVNAIGCIVSGSPDVAIKELLRSLPLILCFFMTLWTLLLIHGYYRNVSPKRRQKSLKKNSIAILCFAGITILYVIIALIVGKFTSIVEGSPFPIYPLDTVLYSVVFAAIGVCGLVVMPKMAAKHEYVVPSRGPIVTKARFFYCFGVSIWMLVAVYGAAAFVMGLFIIDFLHGYLAFSIALMVVFLVDALSLICWELVYNNLKEEARKKLLLPLALAGLCVSVFAAGFYFIALGFNLDGPANVGFGVLPIAFSASVNIATFILVLTPVIVSVIALIKGLILRKK